jgi:hypothetical protein
MRRVSVTPREGTISGTTDGWLRRVGLTGEYASARNGDFQRNPSIPGHFTLPHRYFSAAG